MAIGPFARILAQVVVPVIAVLARAIPAAYGQALNNARKAGGAAAADAAAKAPLFGKKIMSQSEALSILNLSEQKVLTPEAVQKVSTVERKKEFSKLKGCYFLILPFLLFLAI